MEHKRKLWEQPWQYKEGFIVSIFIVIVGAGIGYFSNGKPFLFPNFPMNLGLITSYTIFIFIIYIFERKSNIVKWLSSIPVAISSTILITLVSVILGFIPQLEESPKVIDFYYKIGLTHLTTSWLFALSYLFFTTSLGFATAKIMIPFRKKKMGTILSHLGLYIIIIAAVAGSGDIQRTYFILENNKPTNVVTEYGKLEKKKKLPFKLELLHFDIQEYAPKIVLVKNNEENTIILQDNKRPFHANDTIIGNFKNFKIKVLGFYKYAVPTDTLLSNYVDTMLFGASPVAFVEIKNTKNNEISKQWVTCGSFAMYRVNAFVNEDYFFAMLNPEPKEYSSLVRAWLPGGKTEEFKLKVNEPHSIMGWKLYQTGYNDKLGKWSNYSIIEAGKDPWLKFVYLGIFILMAGAVYIFWLGRKFSKTDDIELENVEL